MFFVSLFVCLLGAAHSNKCTTDMFSQSTAFWCPLTQNDSWIVEACQSTHSLNRAYLSQFESHVLTCAGSFDRKRCGCVDLIQAGTFCCSAKFSCNFWRLHKLPVNCWTLKVLYLTRKTNLLPNSYMIFCRFLVAFSSSFPPWVPPVEVVMTSQIDLLGTWISYPLTRLMTTPWLRSSHPLLTGTLPKDLTRPLEGWGRYDSSLSIAVERLCRLGSRIIIWVFCLPLSSYATMLLQLTHVIMITWSKAEFSVPCLKRCEVAPSHRCPCVIEVH